MLPSCSMSKHFYKCAYSLNTSNQFLAVIYDTLRPKKVLQYLSLSAPLEAPEFFMVFSQLSGSPAPKVSRKFIEKRFSGFFSELSILFRQLATRHRKINFRSSNGALE